MTTRENVSEFEECINGLTKIPIYLALIIPYAIYKLIRTSWCYNLHDPEEVKNNTKIGTQSTGGNSSEDLCICNKCHLVLGIGINTDRPITKWDKDEDNFLMEILDY